MTTNSLSRQSMPTFLQRFKLQRGLAFGIIILTALLAFEIFNYSTTDYALTDLLGDLKFLGLRWATILSVAFCGIDFAGIARLFTPERGGRDHSESWYLFGAWMLAATMNAMLTWWGVSLAVLGHQTLGNAVVGRDTLLRVVPIFVAVLIWLIRVLIIGTFSAAGDRLFSQEDQGASSRIFPEAATPGRTRAFGNRRQAPRTAAPSANMRPAPKPTSTPNGGYSRPESTYHPVSMSQANGNGANDTLSRPPLKRPAPQVRR